MVIKSGKKLTREALQEFLQEWASKAYRIKGFVNLKDGKTIAVQCTFDMVEIFEVITQAMKDKKGANPADQLAYASDILRRKQSGSAQVYANGLAQASQQFQGKSVTTDNAGLLAEPPPLKTPFICR